MMDNIVFVALGSNIGDRELFLDQAVLFLGKSSHTRVECVSAYINTVAETPDSQSDYLNAVLKIRTSLSYRTFFDFCVAIEKQLGRKGKGDCAPRTIDIDILLFNDECVSEEDLIIPHPLMHQRVFVLKPFLDIDGSIIHPVLNKTIQELYDHLYEYSG
ncbi:2-amino-4-hydroxy-6-hydroxymethyldihydropteridine diphosphokinase [Candidatus Marinamargulisbacteria bacterium SCGC AG-343-D04]|nr:2-amino-4-hydroxy-6-hydroxymethyldihydropteridine diphosphokinase [Candidatus Marinamargulisbacteria bacterium SCGC AG-343-D04]